MPKAKWGSGDQALSAADIDGVEVNDNQFYTGDLPPAGLYRFVLKSIKKGESSTGNPKALVFATLDGTWKKEHAKFEGCPLWDHMPVMKSTAFRVRAFCDAIGVTSKEFLTQTVTDEDDKVIKIGRTKIQDEDLLVFINVQVRPAQGEYAASLQLRGTGYLPVSDDEVEDAEEDDDSTAVSEDEPPF